jgi:hypothetical protein
MRIQDGLPRSRSRRSHGLDPGSDQYYLGPTQYQLKTIALLIEELPDGELDWLLRDNNIEFWLASWGRAKDLITTIEEVIEGNKLLW